MMITFYCYYCTIVRTVVAIGYSIVGLCCASIIVLGGLVGFIARFYSEVIVSIVTVGL